MDRAFGVKSKNSLPSPRSWRCFFHFYFPPKSFIGLWFIFKAVIHFESGSLPKAYPKLLHFPYCPRAETQFKLDILGFVFCIISPSIIFILKLIIISIISTNYILKFISTLLIIFYIMLFYISMTALWEEDILFQSLEHRQLLSILTYFWYLNCQMGEDSRFLKIKYCIRKDTIEYLEAQL